MRRIKLTFDNGPTPGVSEDVLAVLAKEEIRATFFVVGRQLAEPGARDIAAAAHASGHWIGNHTWSHDIPFGTRTDKGFAEREIGRTQDLIGDLAHDRRFFRPFGGGGIIGPHLLDTESLEFLAAGGFTCVLWNAIPGDWRDPSGWVETALAQCAALDHALVVLHDLPTGAMRNLQRFITRSKAEGATFVQDFPAQCVPLERGNEMQDLSAFVSASPVQAKSH